VSGEAQLEIERVAQAVFEAVLALFCSGATSEKTRPFHGARLNLDFGVTETL
jgi:hypothetical protein